MVGAYSDNQPDYNWSFPYESKEFTHYWYGIRDMGGVKAGSRHAALNLDRLSSDRVLVGANATEKYAKLTLELRHGDEVLYTRQRCNVSCRTDG